MSASLVETAARSVGSLRLGKNSIPGQGRLVDALGRLAGRMGGGRGVASPWPGVTFEADLNDRIQRQMWAGVYEPHVRDCFGVLLRPGDVYFDVGGHIGYHAVAAAHQVGVNGRVFAFEADPAMHGRLARNLEQFPWAKAVHAAVWDSNGVLAFERSSVDHESGWGTLCTVRDLGKGEHIRVRSISLDDWCREERVERLDMVKIDAEGSELAVLRGARSVIEQFHPTIMVEINGILLEQAGSSSMEVVQFLEASGYRLYHLSFQRLDPWDSAKNSDFSDTLCLPGNHAEEALECLMRKGFV